VWARREPACTKSEVGEIMNANEHGPPALPWHTPIGDAVYVLKLIRELELRLWNAPAISANPRGESALDETTCSDLAGRS